MSEPDFENSILVEVITYTIYVGWLSLLAGVALYFEVPPLPSIQAAFTTPWQGTVAAIGTGVGFFVVSRFIYDAARSRMAPSTPESDPEPEPSAPPEPVPAQNVAPKSKSKKKRKKRRR
ncbi:MAG: hypothetical protein AAFV53_27590 [Myxococcota bacterium]